MDAAVCPRTSGQHKTLPEEDPKRLFDLLLDRIGICLDLKSAVIIPFISQFEKVSGHGMKLRVFKGGRSGSEFPCIHGIRKQVDQFGKMVVRYEGICGLQEFEFGGIGRENLTKRADLIGAKAFDFEYLICDLDAVIVLIGVEHPNPQFVDIVFGGKGVAVGIDEGQA